MLCEICGNQLSKNGIKNGVQYYYCTACKKSYSGKPHTPKHSVYEEYLARLLFLKCVKKENEFTHTKWTINQIARLLGQHHRDVSKWITIKIPTYVDKNDLAKYLKNRKNGFDISCVLGYSHSRTPSETLNNIIHRKQRLTTSKSKLTYHLNEEEYLRLINMPISNRKEAIFVLGALLGCRTSEILGAKYSDINYEEKTIHFQRTVTFGKTIEQSENNMFITNRTYPLTERMFAVIKWLQVNNERNKEMLNGNYNNDYIDFLCVKENGELFEPFALNKQTYDIQEKASIITQYFIQNTQDNIIKNFQFKWLRNSVKQMMIKAGVNATILKSIFGYKNESQNENQLENMKIAYTILDRYLNTHIT